MSSLARSGDGYFRTHKSGSEKRKQKKKEQSNVEKLRGSILKFMLPPQEDDVVSGSISGVDDDTPTPCDPTIPHDHAYAEGEKRDNALTVMSSESSLDKTNITFIYDPDPENWVISSDLMEYLAEHPPDQNCDHDMNASARLFGTKTVKTRYAQKQYSHRILANGEKVKREWLIYSLSRGCVYCYACKVYGDNNVEDRQFQSGYDDWKNATARISAHEHSKESSQLTQLVF